MASIITVNHVKLQWQSWNISDTRIPIWTDATHGERHKKEEIACEKHTLNNEKSFQKNIKLDRF